MAEKKPFEIARDGWALVSSRAARNPDGRK
jgi:hypothetical protein